MKIGTKLFLTFLTTVLAGIAVGGVGVFHLTQVKGLEEAMYQENIQSMEALMAAQTDYLKMRIVIRDLVFSQDPGQIQDFNRQLQGLDATFRLSMKEYRRASGVDRSAGLDAQTLDRFQTAYESYQGVLQLLIVDVQSGNLAGARTRMYSEGAEKATTVSGQMENLVLQVHQSAEKRYRESVVQVREATTLTVVVLLLATLFSVGAALFLTRTLARPLVHLADLSRRLAGGDLTIASTGAASRRKDEVGILARAVDSMALGLRDFVRALQEPAPRSSTSPRTSTTGPRGPPWLPPGSPEPPSRARTSPSTRRPGSPRRRPP